MAHLVDQDSYEMTKVGTPIWSGVAIALDEITPEVDATKFSLILVEVSFMESGVEVKKSILCTTDYAEYPTFAGSLFFNATTLYELFAVSLWTDEQTPESQPYKNLVVGYANKINNPLESTKTIENITVTKIIGIC